MAVIRTIAKAPNISRAVTAGRTTFRAISIAQPGVAQSRLRFASLQTRFYSTTPPEDFKVYTFDEVSLKALHKSNFRSLN